MKLQGILISLVVVAIVAILLVGIPLPTGSSTSTTLEVSGFPESGIYYWIPNVGLVEPLEVTVRYEDSNGGLIPGAVGNVLITAVGSGLVFLDVPVQNGDVVTIVDTDILPYTYGGVVVYVTITFSADGYDSQEWLRTLNYRPS
jgi:hypothetical protein